MRGPFGAPALLDMRGFKLGDRGVADGWVTPCWRRTNGGDAGTEQGPGAIAGYGQEKSQTNDQYLRPHVRTGRSKRRTMHNRRRFGASPHAPALRNAEARHFDQR
jgi:hypothetical protein